MRKPNLIDRCLTHLDQSLKVMTTPAVAQRPMPATDNHSEAALSKEDQRLSIALMRVNHAGEMAAQGLYIGQSISARKDATAQKMRQMAHEESDHLAWCETRLKELQGSTSVLTPLWYLGSASIGMLAGIFGDRYSFGFVKETEDQVVAHLDSHLSRIAPSDQRTIAVIEQIKHDEQEHAHQAELSGSTELPRPIKQAMRLTAKCMTSIAHHV